MDSPREPPALRFTIGVPGIPATDAFSALFADASHILEFTDSTCVGWSLVSSADNIWADHIFSLGGVSAICWPKPPHAISLAAASSCQPTCVTPNGCLHTHAGLPAPGSKRERDLIEAAQPRFLEEYRLGARAARDASHSDGHGGGTHTAVNHWKRLLGLALGIDVLRPVDPRAPLQVLLSEVDVVECYAWWLVTQVRVNHETARNYVSVVNAWHHRQCHVNLAGGFSLGRVHEMLRGLARLKGVPPVRLVRLGIRPASLRAGLDAIYPLADAASLNRAACMEVTFASLRRPGETAVGDNWSWHAERHPTRADVSFHRDASGTILYATLMAVNSKAKGVEALRKLPFRLPMTGRYLSPGQLLHLLTEVVDPVPLSERATTPLFRDPNTGCALRVAHIRSELRRAMYAIGLDGTLYGAHSLRIGGATALAFEGAEENIIKAAGVWSSDAYLRYLRETGDRVLRNVSLICDAEVDDLATNDFLDLESGILEDEDFE